jgi:crossover junction endodeoxyribonuclease RuvC
MKIIGIDPGYDRVGISILEKSGSNNSLIYSECIQTSTKDNIYDRFKKVALIISEKIEKYKPEHMAIETLFITKNQKTAMRVSECRGIIIYQAIINNIPIYEYSPMQIKSAITSNGRSDKKMIARMVDIIVGKNSKKIMLDDEYDAVAVALTHSAYFK